ncbi:signal peptidase I domain protein, partial [Chlamydia psittaci 06-1683]
ISEYKFLRTTFWF